MLGIRYPVFQGGMAWVADGKLAAAVSEGGGLGIIGAGNAPASFVREQIAVVMRTRSRRALRRSTSRSSRPARATPRSI